MILTIDMALRGVADMLRDRLAPAINDRFAGESARLAELVVRLNADWVDDAAAVRVGENASIRALFREASPLLAGALATRISEAAMSSDPGLRLSDLDRESSRLRALLSELHAEIESRDTGFSERIWQLLEQLEAARAPC